MKEFIKMDLVLYTPLDKVLKDFGYGSSQDETFEIISITAGRKKVEMKLGESIGYLNGLEISLQGPPKAVDGLVYLPVTFFTDILDLEIDIKDEVIGFSKEKEKTSAG